MTKRAPRDTQLHCPRCGFTTPLTTAGLAAHGLRLHSCDRWLAIAARKARGDAQRAAIDTTRRDCQHTRTRHAHGERNAYVLDRCRCTPCRHAHRDYERMRHRRKGYGTWQPFVDADPVRQHVAQLRAAGLGWKRIADAAGVSHGGMTKLLYGLEGRPPSQRVRHETAARLLAVTTDTVEHAPGAIVDAAATWRRIEGLVALGYPLAWIARQIGQQRALQIRSDQVLARTARAIAQLAEQIGDRPGPSNRARRYAADRGWLTPIQQYAQQLEQEADSAPRLTRSQVLLEDARWLLDGGLSPELTAERLGITLAYLQNLLAGTKGRGVA